MGQVRLEGTVPAGHPLRYLVNRSYLNSHPLMPKSCHSVSALAAILLLVAALIAVPSARAQDFTMQTAAPFSPPSLEPGGSAVATVSLSPSPGFSGSVSLFCA